MEVILARFTIEKHGSVDLSSFVSKIPIPLKRGDVVARVTDNGLFQLLSDESEVRIFLFKLIFFWGVDGEDLTGIVPHCASQREGVNVDLHIENSRFQNLPRRTC